MKKETHIHARATVEVAQKLKELAESQNRTVANYLETIINREYTLLQLGLQATGVEPIEGETIQDDNYNEMKNRG
jgi:hypothetical protein